MNKMTLGRSKLTRRSWNQMGHFRFWPTMMMLI